MVERNELGPIPAHLKQSEKESPENRQENQASQAGEGRCPPSPSGNHRQRASETESKNQKLIQHPCVRPPTLKVALAQLLADCEAFELPEIVPNLIVAVLQKPLKLFCAVGEVDPADRVVGTMYLEPGLYASNLFVELLAAVRTLQWEVVVVILEQALTPLVSISPVEDHR
jgi:hypothetical protein